MRARSAGARSLAAVDVGSAGAGGGGAKTVHPSTLARFFGLNKSGADEHREHGAKLAALHRLLRARGAAAARACAHHPGTQTCVAPALRAAPRQARPRARVLPAAAVCAPPLPPQSRASERASQRHVHVGSSLRSEAHRDEDNVIRCTPPARPRAYAPARNRPAHMAMKR